MTKAQDTDTQTGEYDELMERLAEKGSSYFGNPDGNKMCCDAYDAIDALTQEKETLQASVREWRDEAVGLEKKLNSTLQALQDANDVKQARTHDCDFLTKQLDKARAALEEIRAIIRSESLTATATIKRIIVIVEDNDVATLKAWKAVNG